MSCLSAISSQIFTFILEPHEVLSLNHKVFQEYAKVAFSEDFSHTFPSFILITAIGIKLYKSLNLNWLKIPDDYKFLHNILWMMISWIIINATLWHWLIIQRILYCVVWNHWRNDIEILEIYSPWWKSVFSTYYPQSKRPMLSADTISWCLSMTISLITLFCIAYTNVITSISRRTSEFIGGHFKTINAHQMSSSVKRKLREMTPCYFDTHSEIFTDKSELGSSCDDSKSDISVEYNLNHTKMINHEISPISYGTNWTPVPKFKGRNS